MDHLTLGQAFVELLNHPLFEKSLTFVFLLGLIIGTILNDRGKMLLNWWAAIFFFVVGLENAHFIYWILHDKVDFATQGLAITASVACVYLTGLTGGWVVAHVAKVRAARRTQDRTRRKRRGLLMSQMNVVVRNPKFYVAVAALILMIVLNSIPGFVTDPEQAAGQMVIVMVYLYAVIKDPGGSAWSDMLKSRKFWAALIGEVVLWMNALHLPLPYGWSYDKLMEVVMTVVSGLILAFAHTQTTAEKELLQTEREAKNAPLQ